MNRFDFLKSVREGVHALKGWYNLFGTVVAVLAVANFVFSLLRVDLSHVLDALLVTYRAIVHGIFGWVLLPFHIELPGWANDLLFLYLLAGGAVARSVKESPLMETSKFEWTRAWSNLLGTEGKNLSPYRRWRAFLLFVPPSIRAVERVLLWPPHLRDWFVRPRVHFDDYYGTNDFWFYPAGTRTSKPFEYDRRVSVAVHLVVIALGFFAVVVVNAFLTVPR